MRLQMTQDMRALRNGLVALALANAPLYAETIQGLHPYVKTTELLKQYKLSPKQPIQFDIEGKKYHVPRGVFLEMLLQEPYDVQSILDLPPKFYRATPNDSPLHRLAGIFSGKFPVKYDPRTGGVILEQATELEKPYPELTVMHILADRVLPDQINAKRNRILKPWAPPNIMYGDIDAGETIVFEKTFVRTLQRIARDFAQSEEY